MTIGELVYWRGEMVIIVKIAGTRAQVARPRVGLKWVNLAQLSRKTA